MFLFALDIPKSDPRYSPFSLDEVRRLDRDFISKGSTGVKPTD